MSNFLCLISKGLSIYFWIIKVYDRIWGRRYNGLANCIVVVFLTTSVFIGIITVGTGYGGDAASAGTINFFDDASPVLAVVSSLLLPSPDAMFLPDFATNLEAGYCWGIQSIGILCLVNIGAGSPFWAGLFIVASISCWVLTAYGSMNFDYGG